MRAQSAVSSSRWAQDGGDVDGRVRAAEHVVARQLRAAAPRRRADGDARRDRRLRQPATTCSPSGARRRTPHRPLAQLAHVLGRPEESIRVVVPDVGGAFGSKGVLGARRRRWSPSRRSTSAGRSSGPRTGSRTSWPSYQGRGMEADVELALDADGRMLALRARICADLGGYLMPTTAIPPHTPRC